MKILSLIILSITLTACVTAPPVHIPEVPPPTQPIAKHMNVGLALGAGGAKGYAHLGVIAVLEEAGVPIDLIAGASAGSIVGSLYADKGSIKHAFDAMMTSDLADFLSIDLHIGGFASGNKLEKFVFDHLHATTFKQLKIPMLIATTDLVSGHEYTISSGPVAPAVLASATVPGLIRPSQLYGKRLVDGGVTDPIPVNLLLPYKPKLTIGVNISTALPKKVPTLALDIYHQAYAIMWNDLCEHTAGLADVVIHPEIIDTSMFDVSKKMSLYYAGRTAAQKALPKILELMRQRGIPVRKKATHTTI